MIARLVLRSVAIVIALLGLVDPVLTVAGRVRTPLIASIDTTHAEATSAATALQTALGDGFDVTMRGIAASGDVPVCGPGETCVLVGAEPWLQAHVDNAGRLAGLIRLPRASGAGLRIASVTQQTAAAASAVGQLLVELETGDVPVEGATLNVFDGDVPVGHATVETARVPVSWWPIGAGLRRLSVRVARTTDGTTHEDDRVDVGVEVGATPYNVLVYDTRPAWTSTFVRRAVEHDTRLALRVVSRIGPQLEVSAGAPFRFDEATLTQASAVIVGAPDELTGRDVDLLERFVRVRGGSLLLVPDRRPTGPVTRLLPPGIVERLEPAPIRVGDWRASEMLTFRDVAPENSVLARAAGGGAAGEQGNGAPIVVAMPTGNGRIVISGAMDAWRYRDSDEGAFDRAWQSLVADAAAAGGRSVEVTLDRHMTRPHEPIQATVRLRDMATPPTATAVGAVLACGDGRERVVRLWPAGDARQFTARLTIAEPGACRLTVSATAPATASADAAILVAEDIHSLAIFSKGSDPGAMDVPVVEAGDEMTLARDVQRLLPAEPASVPMRPMHSPWWIVPFAACLGTEWWLRRRRGLR